MARLRDCAVPAPEWAALCEKHPTHDGDHRAGDLTWPRTECWVPAPPGYAHHCVLDAGHDGRHTARTWPGSAEQREPARMEWDERGVSVLPNAPLPRPAWTPNPLAERDPEIASCGGHPVCSYCTPEKPGPVGVPVIIGGLPGQQIIAAMVAHTRGSGG
ncbi:hypothetical protein ACFWNL_18450 [Kitasatospora sp. NPDC058397]|uniref:hypothetical protein n=1 Tax=unclassified Kitasatospora TaxID=2633591 RepID=UPI003653CDD9